MPEAQLYFLSDQYYKDFPDDKLMKNKDNVLQKQNASFIIKEVKMLR